jgi:16S rRNA processing protein RimM
MLKHPNYFQLGRILRTHGLAGDVVCLFETEKPQAYTKLKGFFVESNGMLLPHFIEKISLRGEEALLSLEGIKTSDQAAKLKGAAIYLPIDKLPKLPKDEFFIHDMLGCQLSDVNLGVLGTVEDIVETAGQSLIVFQYQGKEVLLPFVKEFVTDIDLEKKELKTQLPDGLLDIYLEEKKGEQDDALDE